MIRERTQLTLPSSTSGLALDPITFPPEDPINYVGIEYIAPNIDSGTPWTMSAADGDSLINSGPAFIATATDLFFDFSSAGLTGAFTVFQDTTGPTNTVNFWCLAGSLTGCAPGAAAFSEIMGFTPFDQTAQQVGSTISLLSPPLSRYQQRFRCSYPACLA